MHDEALAVRQGRDDALTVLVVDDEAPLRRSLGRLLGERGHRVLEAGTGREGLDIAAGSTPDLVLLDGELPDMPGDAVCRELRAWTGVPILALSARREEQDTVRLLEAGADDCVARPFSAGELLARVRALVRRSRMPNGVSAGPLCSGDLVIDLPRRRVTRAGAPVGLSPIEWGLLRTLVAARGRTLTHEEIFESVWGRRFGDAKLYLRVYVSHLRRKLEPAVASPALIVTDPGVGYRFELPPNA